VTSQATARAGLKQETIAIVAVGATILGTMLFTTNRLEVRMDRAVAELRSEARADRASPASSRASAPSRPDERSDSR